MAADAEGDMPGESGGSVTQWIGNLQAGDLDAAARRLWGRYFDQIARLAHAKLRATPRGPADGEDVALSVFDSFYARAAAGEFPHLGGRDDLWRLLVTITARKAANQLRREHQEKRGGGRVLDEGVLDRADPDAGRFLSQVVGDEPSPAFAAMVTDELRRRLEGLRDASFRQVAVMRMEGYSNAEIADHLGTTVRGVERKLAAIRKRWQEQEGDHP
jgi:DNA-directed RNA polymerase specialized sigma24 family protein